MGSFTTFEERDENLRTLGFLGYAEYLESGLWEWIKSTLAADPATASCLCCGSRSGLVWHHRDYRMEVLVGNFSNQCPQIVRLCSECHRAIHVEGDSWLPMEVVDRRLLELQMRLPAPGSRIDRSGLTTKSDAEIAVEFAEEFGICV